MLGNIRASNKEVLIKSILESEFGLPFALTSLIKEREKGKVKGGER
jgi:hypothetical protein